MGKFNDMEDLLERLKSGKKSAKQEKAPKKEKQKEINADLNEDGVVDEKDLDLAREAVEDAKRAKKIVKNS